MSKARDLANAGTALGAVSATELAYVDGVTSAIQTQIDAKEATLPSQTGNSGKYLTTDGSAKSWGTVSQYALPSQTGNSGKFLTTNGTAESWATVTTPITWTQRLAGTGSTFNSIAYNGSNLYVAVGDAGVLYSSPDALTWTSRTSGFGANAIYQVAYGNALWVAVGANGVVTTSTDGTTWTARTSNFGASDNIYDVVYANSLWVAVGTGGGTINTGGLIYSSDGITWTRKSQSVAVGGDYKTVVYNGTNWIIGSNYNGSNNFLYASAPSGTWTVGTTTSVTDIGLILWDGTRHIIGQTTQLGYNTSVTLSGTTTRYEGPSIGTAGTTTKNLIKLYSNVLYRFSTAMQTYVPVSTAYPTISVPVLLPVTNIGSTNVLGVSIQTSFVGAAGIILIGNSGRIYTSF